MFGQSAVFTARTINLPPGGSCRWWPATGEEMDGLRAVQSSHGSVTLRAERCGGKAAVMVRYRHNGGEATGKAEVMLAAR